MQKRARVVESQKLRRTMKGRCKLNDPIRDSVSVSMAYFRLFILWLLIITIDVLVGFRFELLWPFWLVSRACYESFSKNQNTVVTLANQNTVKFSLFFVCVTATSDLVCLILIPVPWMIFLASTYVWVSLIWSTHGGFRLISLGGGERSQVVPIALLGFFVITFEFFCRKRCDLLPYVADGNPFSSYIGLTKLPSCEHIQGLSSTIPRNLNAFFGAHCIGYPLVLISFSIRYYFREWLISRTRVEVSKRNELYQRLLTEALPAVYEGPRDYSIKSPPLEEAEGELLDLPVTATPMIMPAAIVSNGTHSNGSIKRSSAKQASGVRNRGNGRTKTSTSVNNASQRTNERRREEEEDSDGSDEWREGAAKSSGGPSWLRLAYEGVSWLVGTLTHSVEQEVDEEDDESQADDLNKKVSRNGDVNKGRGAASNNTSTGSSNNANAGSTRKGRGREKAKEKSNSSQIVDREKSSNGLYISNGGPHPAAAVDHRDSSRDTSISQSVITPPSSSLELERLRTDVMHLRAAEQDARLQLSVSRNNEAAIRQEVNQMKNSVERMENRYSALEKLRETDRSTITQLDKKYAELLVRKNEVERELFNERNARKEDGGKRSETAEQFRERERQLERDIDRLRAENATKEDRMLKLEYELNDLRKYRENNENDVSGREDELRTLRDKVKALEESLQSENKLKQDLFRALGDARTQNAHLEGRLPVRQQLSISHRFAPFAEKLRDPSLSVNVQNHQHLLIPEKISPSAQSINSSPPIASASMSPPAYNIAVQQPKVENQMGSYLYAALQQHHSSPTGEHMLFDQPASTPSPCSITPPDQLWSARMGKFGAPANPTRSN